MTNSDFEAAQVPPRDALKTYLYLRIGLIGAAVLLAAAICIEIAQVSFSKGFCIQPSISSYYYTPVRAVFVGSMFIIAVALVAIKGAEGDRWWKSEDVWLNLGGMMAPVVAFVPTTSVGDCWSVKLGAVSQMGSVTASNMLAVLIVGVVAWLFAAYLLRRESGIRILLGPHDAWKGWRAVGYFILFYILWFIFSRDSFDHYAHMASAIALFVFLFAAAVTSARRADEERFRKRYGAVAIAMAAAAVLVLAAVILFKNWNHAAFTIEALEIGYFAYYWSVQTREHWPRAN